MADANAAAAAAAASDSAPSLSYSAQELGKEIEDLLRTPASDGFRFNEQERRILKTWDEIEELRLETHVLKAQHDELATDDTELSALSDSELQAAVARAERELLTARSTYTIRQNIIQQVLIADPILKSIHSGHDGATPLSRRLRPLIDERDVVSMVSSTLSSHLRSLRQRISRLEQENVDLLDLNRALAERMLVLAEEAKTQKVEDVDDAQARRELERLDKELVQARRRWRMWKSVVGGIIAGSGVDWASDEKLLEAVMDEEDELG